MSSRNLEGKVAIVTGASSGLGWQSAVRLAERGVRLCVTARRGQALDLLRTDLVRRGVECVAVPADVTKENEVHHVVSVCLERFGDLDLLVNVAGVQDYAFFTDYAWSEIERVLDTNLFGYMRFARAVLPHFFAQRSGHIVNVASMLSKGAAPLLSSYTASKHAILGWAKCLALEVRDRGVSVSNVLAPSVATPMFDHAPTHLGVQPRPVPPTYDPDVVARAVVRCALRPRPEVVPVFLQGSLILWLNRHAPWIGNLILRRFGVRLQSGDSPIERPDGNLYAPVLEGVGPRGSVPPTPRWKLYGGAAALALAAAGVVGGATYGAARALRAR